MKPFAIATLVVCSVLFVCGVTSTVQAQKIYKWTDENGTTHYSTTPPPEAEVQDTELEATKRYIPNRRRPRSGRSVGPIESELDAIRVVRAYPSSTGGTIGSRLAQKVSLPAVRELGWKVLKENNSWTVEYRTEIANLRSPTIYRWRLDAQSGVKPVNGHAIEVTAGAMDKGDASAPGSTNRSFQTNAGDHQSAETLANWIRRPKQKRIEVATAAFLGFALNFDPEAVPDERGAINGFKRAGGEMLEECMTRLGQTHRDPSSVSTSSAGLQCYRNLR